MNTRITVKLLILMVLAAIVIGVAVYPSLPERIATHWNAQGTADGFSGRAFGVFLLPAIMLFLIGIYFLVPAIDPLRKNIASFRRSYNLFWFAITAFMLYVFVLTLLYNSGRQFDFGMAMLPGLAALFWVIGIMLPNLRRSWFIGIRTPWTLSDDQVWERTHRLGGKLFRAAAILSLGGLLFGGATTIWFIIVPVLTAAVVSVVASFVFYRRLHRA